ncbi:MAG: alpha-xylosidase [Clostridiales bacterium]|nr:alpha-xylosidase [Bacillota bacterium]NLK02990.1 alpha-xylosidase [Clostridiales bacterium]
MKFSNGCWLQKEGTEVFSPAEVYFVKKDDQVFVKELGSFSCREIILSAPTHKINHRGDTLGGINLTIRISSPMDEVLRIRTDHYLGVRERGPGFELEYDLTHTIDVNNQEDMLIIHAGKLRLEINKKTWKMEYYRDSEKITDSGFRDLAYVKTDWRGLAYDKGGIDNTYMRERLSLSVGELIYGLGERFTPFVKNGQSVDIWNEDGGTSTEQSYKNVPFYISNMGYGVFVNHPERVSFEIGSEMVKKVQFSVAGEGLDYFLINGPTMKEVIKRYTSLTGKPAKVAPWTFGLWLSTSFTTNYDEETVNSFVDGMLEREIPLKVFHFDCFWMKDFHWSNFTWDSDVFPDPKGMISRLKKKGLKICVWINSYIAQESSMFAEGVENGYFVKRPNGDVWQWDMWQPGMAIVDFTNPLACSWYRSKLEALIDMGVDCFKTDFGERIPTDVVYYDGSDPYKMHNYYSYLYNKLVFEILEEKLGKDEAVLFARSATAGGQKFPVHWGGDCWSDYESMAESLRGGLSLTMSGFAYWSHDIGGFESTSTPDVYKRWAAFGLLSTHSRLHGSHSYRVPWAYDEESVEVVRYFTRLKASLMPYLFSNSIESSESGIPVMRSMVMEFMDDPSCGYLDKQYMLGDSLLVAPIFNDEGIGQYYLPEGKWTNYQTGEVKTGGRWIKEKHGYLSIPIMVRQGSILPIGPRDDDPVYDYSDDVILKVYELQDNDPATRVVYNDKGDASVSARIIKEGNKIHIDVRSDKKYTVLLININTVKSVTNGSFQINDQGTIIVPDGPGQLVCYL